MPQYWLVKTEPSTYSFENLQKDSQTVWNGIRNFQARNHLKQIKKGDSLLIYHTGEEKAVVGIAHALGAAYPESKNGPWVQVDIAYDRPLKKPVSLKDIKASPSLKDLALVKQSRLSVMPVRPEHYSHILKMGGLK